MDYNIVPFRYDSADFNALRQNVPEDMVRKVYGIVSEQYDAGSFDTFKQKMQEEDTARKVYEIVSKQYDAGDFNQFYTRLGLKPKTNTVAAPVKGDVEGGVGPLRSRGEYAPVPKGSPAGASDAGGYDYGTPYGVLPEMPNLPKDGDRVEYNRRRDAVPAQIEALKGRIPELSKGDLSIYDKDNYKYARYLLGESSKDINRAQSSKKDNTIGRFSGSFIDELSDRNTLTLGATQLAVMANMLKIAKKADESGLDALSDSERSLAEAFALSQAADTYYAGDLSAANRVGGGVAASIPFMAQFALTSGWGNAAKASIESLVKKITERGIVGRFAGKAAKGVADASTRAAAMSVVQPSTYSNMIERKVGEGVYDFDRNGELKVSGFKGSGTPEAVAKGFASSWIENVSEMSGGYFRQGCFSGSQGD